MKKLSIFWSIALLLVSLTAFAGSGAESTTASKPRIHAVYLQLSREGVGHPSSHIAKYIHSLKIAREGNADLPESIEFELDSQTPNWARADQPAHLADRSYRFKIRKGATLEKTLLRSKLFQKYLNNVNGIVILRVRAVEKANGKIGITRLISDPKTGAFMPVEKWIDHLEDVAGTNGTHLGQNLLETLGAVGNSF